MGNVMMQGVLRMPPDLWLDDNALDAMQRHSFYVEAADKLEAYRAFVDELKQMNKCMGQVGEFGLHELLRKHGLEDKG